MAAPALILSRAVDAQIVRPCGPGGFCIPPAVPMAPFFRDWSKLGPAVGVINPQSYSATPNALANAADVRLENAINGITYTFTESAVDSSNSGFSGNWSIGTWTSPNSIDGPWTYAGVAIPASAGAWDDNQLYNPSCINIGGTWYLYYSGISAINVSSIGVATSATMLPGSWTKYSGNPIITGGGGGPADPYVIKAGSQYVMYTAENYPGGSRILYFTSPDGLTWTFGGVALPAAVMGDWDYGQHSWFEPHVFKNKYGFYEMTYDTTDVHNALGAAGQSVGYATSSDGLSFTKYATDPLPYIWPGPAGQLSPVEKNNELYVFGDTFTDPTTNSTGGVGLSKMADF